MVEFRLAEEKDSEKINAFHNRIYHSNRTLKQFYWEFHHCPFGKSIYVIAEDNQQIVGTNCVIPIDLIDSEGIIIRTGKSEDTLVDPTYRGQKIFYKIYEFLFDKCREANIEIIWGFTSALKPFKNLGFTVPFNHQQSLAVNHIGQSYAYLSSLNPANKVLDKFKILALCLLSKIKTVGKIKQQKLNFTVDEPKQFEAGVSALIATNVENTTELFAINQTAAFQKWRLYENPNFHNLHTFTFYNKAKELVALIVFNSHPNKIAYVSQSTFHSKLTETERTAVLQYAISKLFATGIHMVRNWHFDTNSLNKKEIKTYKSAGTTLLPRGLGFVWKELTDTNLDPHNFNLSRMATQGKI